MIQVCDGLALDESELRFTFARSGGPGGQNVNKVSSRVTVWFDVKRSPKLSEDQKQRVLDRLAGRINRNGVLHVACREHRSQSANREAVVERLASLLAWALSENPPRRLTRIPVRSRAARLEEKRKRSRLKTARSRAWKEAE